MPPPPPDRDATRRPPDDAPREDWKRYAESLEETVGAMERWANTLQSQFNYVISAPEWKFVRRCRNFVASTLLGRFPRARSFVTTAVLKGPAAAFQRIREAKTGADMKYERFLEKHTLTDAMKRDLAAAIDALAPEKKPLISILTPVYNTPPELLEACVDSVRSQIYSNWELCLVDDKSPQSHIRPLLEKIAASDPRIRVTFRPENGNISRASQSALDMAKGEYAALLDHDDVITPDALALVAIELAAHPETELIYSDSDLLEMDGRRTNPYFKPDWSPDTFLSNMYICHLNVFRTETLRATGGFRTGFDGSQDYDLVLRLTERIRGDQIRHIPRVLYSWRRVPGSTASAYSEKSYADNAAKKALEEALQRRGIAGSVEPGMVPSLFRVKRAIVGDPLVSILIPFRDQPAMLEQCLSSIRDLTAYKRYEFILLDNGSTDPEMVRLLDRERAREGVKVLRIDEPFNYSRINNLGAEAAAGEHLLLLNNDTEVIESGWLEAMLEHSQRPEVGAVGARLIFGDGRIQHAGVVLGLGGIAGHTYRKLDDGPGYYGVVHMIRNYSAVTGACLMTRASVYKELGGLNAAELAVAYNDVDYCLRVRERGYLVVYTPYAKLKHHESVSRGFANNPKEATYLCRRWARQLRDPYYNPNLTHEAEDFSINI